MTGFARTTQRYRSRRDPQTELRLRLKDLAVAWVGYGYRRLLVLLRLRDWRVNHKRIYQLYRDEGLSIQAKRLHRRRACRYRTDRPQIEGPNQARAMNFMPVALLDRPAIRNLTIVNCRNRESLAIVPRTGLRAHQVTEALDQLVTQRGRPKTIRCDNAPKFAGPILDQWAYWNRIELDFSRSGKSTDNAFIDAFNATFRAECLNTSWFLSMADVRDELEV